PPDRPVCSLPCHFPRVAGSAVTTADIGQAPCSPLYAVKIELLELTLSLTLMIWPMAGDVELAIRCEGIAELVVLLNLLGSSGARVVTGKDGKFIEFAAANLFAGRYDISRPVPYGFRLRLEPSCQLTAFSYDV
ncbi:hypothetical protein, partial [Rugamonas sp.]|uniref:hypothetical protein n=1 Tax=Rugamonas sp. TaxID=1926287 RepID=UPI0025E6ED66